MNFYIVKLKNINSLFCIIDVSSPEVLSRGYKATANRVTEWIEIEKSNLSITKPLMLNFNHIK